MSLRQRAGLVVLVCIVYALGISLGNPFAVAQQKGGAEPIKLPAVQWEYYSIQLQINPGTEQVKAYHDRLNQVGEEGWELVAISAPGNNGFQSRFVFKRVKK